MNYVFATDDIVTSKIYTNTAPGAGAVPLPTEYENKNTAELRVVGKTVKHLSELDTFFVDEAGILHAISGEGRKAISGSWKDKLVKDEDGWRFETAEEKLSIVKEKAKLLIDTRAETLRRIIVTPGDGQMTTYLAQESEAKLLAADPDTTVPTPYIDALVGIIAPTKTEAVTIILQMSENWNNLNAQINAVRLKTKADIDLAETEEDINDLVATAPWPDVQA